MISESVAHGDYLLPLTFKLLSWLRQKL